MAISPVVSSLAKKYGELSGLIEYHSNEIKRLRVDLMAVDTAIGLFDPEYSVTSIKPKQKANKNQFFRHGEGNRLLMELLRDAGKPLRTPEIFDEACSRKGLELRGTDKKAFSSSLFMILKRLQGKGIVQEVDRIEGVIVWGLA